MSTVAGMSTGLGGCVIFCLRTPKIPGSIMSFTFSLAAGVMTAVSFLELLKPMRDGSLKPVLFAFIGSMFYIFLRRLLPENIVVHSDHKRVDNPIVDDSTTKARQW
jgi:zinc transporter ZupT